MFKTLSLTGLLYLAYRVVLFILSLFDAANSCGILEFCK